MTARVVSIRESLVESDDHEICASSAALDACLSQVAEQSPRLVAWFERDGDPTKHTRAGKDTGLGDGDCTRAAANIVSPVEDEMMGR